MTDDMTETRVWPEGGTTTREEAEAEGLDWNVICLYTEPVDDA